MSLYGRTDSNANVTKAGRGIAATSQAKQVIYVDETEAQLESNKERGLNAPGWWSYFTYTDASGATRHKAEQMVFIAGGDTNANETQADDAVAADVAVTIAISQQPADVTGTVGQLHSMVVGATSTPPGDDSLLTYQWQKKSGRRWVDVAGETGKYLYFNTYEAGDAGTYRCKVNSTNGGTEVISDSATATTA